MWNTNVSGFLIIDKPEGITSFDVIRQLRRITNIRKIGHTGTLDPFATGMMIYCLNKYTRLCSILEAHDKTYDVTMILGSATDTGDNTGKVVSSSQKIVTSDMFIGLEAAALALKSLPIPKYSAVKIDGKRAYKYARENIDVNIPDRDVKILEFTLLDCDLPYIRYRTKVSKGTYIRSLSEWIAAYLGTEGHTTTLRRTAISSLLIDSAVPLQELNSTNWQSHIFTPSSLFESLSSCELYDTDITELLAGRSISNYGEDDSQVLVFDQNKSIRSVAIRKNSILYPNINLG